MTTTDKRPTYFLQEHLHRHTVHGGIGNVDAEKVLMAKGYRPLVFPARDSFSLPAKWKRLWFLLTAWLTLPAGAILVFQYPVYPRLHLWLLRLLALRPSITLVCFMADIDGLKDADEAQLERDKKIFTRYTHFIVHGEAMEKWLKQWVPDAVIEQIQFFDFLTPPVEAHRANGTEIVFAGNLAKSHFLLQLGSLVHQPVKYTLYGAGMEGVRQWPANVTYKGIIEPYALPARLEGAYGLVWDGDSISGCAGPLGAYMAWISHHKLSLYLIAGLPVITAGWAASAPLVEKYGIGFTVNSLHEIPARIAAIGEKDYRQMVQNSRSWAKRISQGKCLGDALDKIEERLNHP